MAADYLQAAREALGDALNSGHERGEHLLKVAAVHAQIATAEALRALIGVLADIPVDEGEEGWRGESRD